MSTATYTSILATYTIFFFGLLTVLLQSPFGETTLKRTLNPVVLYDTIIPQYNIEVS